MEYKKGKSPKNHEFKIKFEKSEKENLQRKADKLGIKLSQYIRLTSLNFDADKLKENKKWISIPY